MAFTMRLVGSVQAPRYLQMQLAQMVGQLVRNTLTYAERQARLGAPKDTSALARSIVAQQRGLVGEVTSPLGYASVMELGRRPGAAPPPQAALAGWARRHGFTGSLFVLARSIGRRGIKGRHYFEKAFQQTVAHLPELWAGTVRDIQRTWGGR